VVLDREDETLRRARLHDHVSDMISAFLQDEQMHQKPGFITERLHFLLGVLAVEVLATDDGAVRGGQIVRRTFAHFHRDFLRRKRTKSHSHNHAISYQHC
jgi:hypothetical protein